MIKRILTMQFVLELQWILRLAFSPMQLDFESAPFSHLGTSPKTCVLYQHKRRKSSFFRSFGFPFCQLQNCFHPGEDLIIIPGIMGDLTVAAVLQPGRCITETAAAAVPQGIQGAVAEQAVEGFRVCPGMAGKEFTGFILIKFITFHKNLPEWAFHSPCSVL